MAKKKLTAKQKDIKAAGGKRVYNKIVKEAKKLKTQDDRQTAENFSEYGKPLDNLSGKEKAIQKLKNGEVKNFIRSKERKIKQLKTRYEALKSELGGNKLKDASEGFKNEISDLLRAQTELNTLIRKPKEKIQQRSKYELKYKEETDQITPYKAWEQDKFQKELFSDPYITTINGYDVKTEMDKILDFINELYSRMDSKKVFCVRGDEKVRLYILDEDEASAENDY